MTRSFVLALLIASITACKKQETASAPPPPPAPAAEDSSAAPATTPAPAAPVITTTRGGAPIITPTESVAIPDDPDINNTLGRLSDELRAYVSATRSRPADFADFAAKDHLHAPAPPAGKAYAISHGKVILVDSH